MTISALIAFTIFVVIVGLVVAALYWIVKSSPIPEPIRGWAAWGILVIGILIVVLRLVGMTGVVT